MRIGFRVAHGPPWPWIAAATVGAASALVAMVPDPLIPLARGYAALCERYPIAALLTNHTPPLPLALLFSLVALALIAGAYAGVVGLLATARFQRRLRRFAGPLPVRVAHVAERLGLGSQLTYLADPAPIACCYGLLRPRVVVTVGLVARLDDAELAAVLAHEREHLRRRDPLRLLALEILAAAAFMFPIAGALRQRVQAQIEVGADRAALAVAPRDALASALLAVLAVPQRPLPAIAGLTATEARIAHLMGQPALPPIRRREAVASIGLVAVISLGTVALTGAADVVEMLCPFCPWFA